MAGPLIAFQLSHGLSKPVAPFRWCFFSFASSGWAPLVGATVTVAANSIEDALALMAAVMRELERVCVRWGRKMLPMCRRAASLVGVNIDAACRRRCASS